MTTEEPDIDFSCRVCGVDCPIAPNPPYRAVCELHCEYHDYQYNPMFHEKRCTYCDKSYYDEAYLDESPL